MACPLDHAWGAVLPVGSHTGCRQFDFRLIFEDAFLALAPGAVVLPMLALRLYSVFRQPTRIVWPQARIVKLSLYGVLGALQLAELGLFASGGGTAATTSVTVPAYAVLFVATVGLAVLSAVEHASAPGPAMLVQAYLLLTLFFDAAILRTRWLLRAEAPGHAMAALLTAGFAVKCGLLAAESLPKQGHFRPPSLSAAFSPEDKAGFFGRSLLLWLNPLFLKGYGSTLADDDMLPVGQELAAARLTDELDAAWQHTRADRAHRLALALMRAFWSPLLLLQLPRLALVGFALAQPILVRAALSYLQEEIDSTNTMQMGYGLIGAFALDYVGIALATVWEQQLSGRLMIRIRGALIGLVFRSSLKLPIAGGGDGAGSSGSDGDNASEAVSLVTTDVERIITTLRWSLNIIPNLVQVGIGLWVLEDHLGAVFVAPVIVAIGCAVASAQVGRNIPPRQRKWMQAIQARVKVTTKAVGELRGIKMSGLAELVAKQIQGLRVAEIDDQKAFRRLQITNIALGNTPAMLTPAVTFVAFAIVQMLSHGKDFNVVTAYASLSLLSILIGPVAELVSTTTNLFSSLSCLDRVQEFLQKEAQSDARILSVVPSSSAALAAAASSTDSLQSEPTGRELQRRGGHALRRLGRSGNADHPGQAALVRITGGSFGWKSDKPILQAIHLEIVPSTFTIVIGPVGSGKSTLLRSILGETVLIAGGVECASPKQIAYCDQEPWILNISIRENILGITPYDEQRYQAVVQACQLHDDFAQLPQGDQTPAGSKGSSLSGGQKQRISLARAAYSGKQLIVVDDTLSGLDASTSVKCFHALFGDNGLFRQDGRSVVFVTHNPQWLPYADEIAVLEDGQITGTGTLRSLKGDNDYVKKLMSAQLVDDLVDVDKYLAMDMKSLTAAGSAAPAGPSTRPVSRPNTTGSSITAGASSSALVSRQESQPAQAQDHDQQTDLQRSPEQEPQQDKPKTETKKVTKMGALRQYIVSLGPRAIWGLVLFAVCLAGCNAAQTLWLKYWVADHKLHPNQNIGKWAGIYMLFAVGSIFFIAVETGYMLLFLVPHSARNLHRRLLMATFAAPLSFIVAHDSGVIVNHFTGDLNLTDLALPLSFLLGFERLVFAVAEIILTCLASGYVALSIPVLAAVLYVLQHVYLKTSRQLRVLELEAKSPLIGTFMSSGSASGLATIRAFAWSAAVERDALALLDRAQRPYYLLMCLQRWLTLVLDLVTAGEATLLMGLAVALRGSMDPGFLGVALVSVMNLGGTLSELIVFYTGLENALGAVTRIRDYVDKTPSEPVAEQAPSVAFPAGAITLSHVSASYGDLAVLADVDLHVPAGAKVAVCGRTGSGKSTLLALMLRLLDPDTGRVLVDGVDLATVAPAHVRTAFVALPQDPLFISGTVRLNLDPFQAHQGDDAPLLSALAKTDLAALIAKKGGLDADLKLEWLSTGQRQLFCMARAMLRTSKILMLDEATSSLDTHTEALINKLIQTEFKDWTVLVVTHRVKSVAAPDSGFDMVVVLKNGRIVEKGTPAELTTQHNSLFSEMVDLQEP